MKTGFELLDDAFLNKGTAFTESERKKLGLEGLLPPCVEDIETQAQRIYRQMERKTSLIEKRRFLMEVFNFNRTLFFHVFSEHLVELMPIVYDPVIAESIEQYSEQFINPQYAAFLSIDHPESIETSLKQAAGDRKIRLIVVTDAEGILGIGDWGTNGVDISVGKLMVYTAAAGIDPQTVLPVVLDCGSNRESLLKDPFYLGNRHKRIYGDHYYDFVNRFVETAENLFPDLYLHFEDFGRSNAATILKKYQKTYPVFNDDCQGTGIITLAGILGAMKINREKLTNHTYMCFGAGTAGAGIADRIFREMVAQGLSEKEARNHFYMVDKQGLLFDDMDDLTPEQKPFARARSEFDNPEKLNNLTAAVMAVRPTILVGTSTAPKTFTKEIVKAMASWCDHPIIFPLSNPTELAEATAEDIIKWSDGRAMVATGIPAEPVEYNGVTYIIGQANNALIYPGLGLGSIAVNASLLTDEMISSAAHSLSEFLEINVKGAAVLPPVSKLTQFSETVANAVAECAVKQGLNRVQTNDVKKAVKSVIWKPVYRNY
ncbi:malic enzyme, NAD binding domain protein [Dialister invisus DSM 15470]|jgi:malic enzyme|uniref:Malic enzyme, NAD binding domain protein n=1 Tax=Dialister invisus DSM 15470 TaxID=592028 RepID=C9LPJ2_9FIRM|nr:malic enzyme, NAD binding domain protein [Dialister invisus DSM 15470]